jgi:hypothetical protein
MLWKLPKILILPGNCQKEIIPQYGGLFGLKLFFLVFSTLGIFKSLINIPSSSNSETQSTLLSPPAASFSSLLFSLSRILEVFI